jgi:hypothetical protein
MRKNGPGLFGHIKEILWTVFIVALIVAFLSLHNWDIIESIQWIMYKCWSIIETIAHFFQRSEGFQKVVNN